MPRLALRRLLAVTLALGALTLAGSPVRAAGWSDRPLRDLGFQPVAEFALGTDATRLAGRPSLGVRPATEALPPEDEYLYGCGPMLSAAGWICDPVGGRLVRIADGATRPIELAGAGRLFDFTAEPSPRDGAPPLVHLLQLAGAPGGRRSLGCPGLDLPIGGAAGVIVETGAGGATIGQTAFFSGETLESGLVGKVGDLGFLLATNRLVDGEVRTGFLLVDRFGALRDLFEIPVLPWPRQVSVSADRIVIGLYRDPGGAIRTLEPREAAGTLLVYEAATGELLKRLVLRAGARERIDPRLAKLRLPAGNGGLAFALDPVLATFLAVKKDAASFDGQPVDPKPFAGLFSGTGGDAEAVFGGDGRFHLYGAQAGTGRSAAVAPDGSLARAAEWTPALPEPRFLTGLQVSATGELYLEDRAAREQFRFAPDGKLLARKTGLGSIGVTSRGVLMPVEGDGLSSRPVIEFDLSLNYLRKFCVIDEPGGRVGTVIPLGMDDQARVHLIHFRDGLPVDGIYDYVTGRRLAERLLAFNTLTGTPVGRGFFLTRDGAVLVALRPIGGDAGGDGMTLRFDPPPEK